MPLVWGVRWTCAGPMNGDLGGGSDEDALGQVAQRNSQSFAEVGRGERDDQGPQLMHGGLEGFGQAFGVLALDRLAAHADGVDAHLDAHHELQGAIVNGLCEQGTFAFLDAG